MKDTPSYNEVNENKISSILNYFFLIKGNSRYWTSGYDAAKTKKNGMQKNIYSGTVEFIGHPQKTQRMSKEASCPFWVLHYILHMDIWNDCLDRIYVIL